MTNPLAQTFGDLILNPTPNPVVEPTVDPAVEPVEDLNEDLEEYDDSLDRGLSEKEKKKKKEAEKKSSFKLQLIAHMGPMAKKSDKLDNYWRGWELVIMNGDPQ